MKIRPYDKYRKIDLPWLEQIPSHWDQSRNKNLLVIKDDRVGSEHSEYTLLSLTKRGIIKRDMENPQGKFPKEFDTYKIVSKNDIIFCLFDIDETPRTVGLTDFEGMITGAYDIFSIENINRRYYYYYYLNLDNFKMMKPLYTGLRKTININRFMRLLTPFPPKEEQDNIVAFLDNKLEKIDKFIDLKTRQIELLKDQKEAMINKAVTKGLDDNVKMKDSGIKEVGEIPEEWKVLRLKYLADSNKRSLKDKEDDNKEIEYIDIGSVGFLNLKNEPVKYIFKDAPSRARRIVNHKDIIISTVRTYLKSMLYIDKNLENKIVSTGFSVITPKEPKISEFLKYSLSASYFIENVIKHSIGVAYPAISDNRLMSMKVVIPKSIGEQNEIFKHIKYESKISDETIDLYKKEIDLIKEYKISLISSVVTGRIDVR